MPEYNVATMQDVYPVETTAGICDASGEPVGVWTVGDRIRITDEARNGFTFYEGFEDRDYAVLGIGVDHVDANDILLLVSGPEDFYWVPVMDAERV